MLNNYKQAGEILRDLPSAVKLLQAGKSVTDTEYHKHLEAERLYLAERHKTAPEETWHQDYVALLKRHTEAIEVFDKATAIYGSTKGKSQAA
ncbi:hypothetical protein EWM64_g8655 [Hericium alpestre]|uniref:Uncharacterized protein n=1 Tax=Hericium alpestre TaxID=135208 RepID=A0A4Y9ZMP9_9AGAM|nr:hypothetical protein EWM64_g8655 [Hericium alpestre]